jgi:hypothetical protein
LIAAVKDFLDLNPEDGLSDAAEYFASPIHSQLTLADWSWIESVIFQAETNLRLAHILA